VGSLPCARPPGIGAFPSPRTDGVNFNSMPWRGWIAKLRGGMEKGRVAPAAFDAAAWM
jgi:hypothetical protein